MKKLAVFALLISPFGLAQANCLGEAQIIAKVAEVTQYTMTTCKVAVDPSSIKHYSSSMTCPLDIDEVLANGISFGYINGHDCPVGRGDSVSGIVVKDARGNLYLE